MSTSAFAGFNGDIFISQDGNAYTRVGEVRDVTLTVNQQEIDATSYDSQGWMENIVGFKSWEMSVEALFLSNNNVGQVALWNSLIAGATSFWRLLPKAGAGNQGYEGMGFITSFEVNVPVDDAVNLSLSIIGTSTLATYNAP